MTEIHLLYRTEDIEGEVEERIVLFAFFFFPSYVVKLSNVGYGI